MREPRYYANIKRMLEKKRIGVPKGFTTKMIIEMLEKKGYKIPKNRSANWMNRLMKIMLTRYSDIKKIRFGFTYIYFVERGTKPKNINKEKLKVIISMILDDIDKLFNKNDMFKDYLLELTEKLKKI